MKAFLRNLWMRTPWPVQVVLGVLLTPVALAMIPVAFIVFVVVGLTLSTIQLIENVLE